MPRKYEFVNGPHLRAADKTIKTSRMMLDLIIALIPLVLFAFIKNGLLPYIAGDTGKFFVMIKPLTLVFVGVASSFVFEGLWFLIVEKVYDFKEILKKVWFSYAIIPGLLIALIVPLGTPIYAIMFGCFMANIIFKMMFGGFGHNIFNPALIGYAILIVSFGAFTVLNPSEIINNVSGTPLALLQGDGLGITSKAFYDSFNGNLWDLFLGTVPGGIGETSALLCVLAFAYLVIRKVINWRVPVIYTGTVFVIALIVGLINDQGIWYPLAHIFSGGLLFGAVFMATEPVTSPRSPNGKIIFAIGLGVLTVFFRLYGQIVGGVATSILVMCLFAPTIDRFCAALRTEKFSYKVILKYVAAVAVFIVIALYVIIRSIPGGTV